MPNEPGMSEYDKSNLISPGDEFRSRAVPKDPPFGMKGYETNINYSPTDPAQEAAEREEFEKTRGGGGSEYDIGRSIETTIARHPDPETVRYVARALQLKEETFNTNGESDKRWEIAHRESTLNDRAIVLSMSLEDLERRGLINPITDPKQIETLREYQRKGYISPSADTKYFGRSTHVEGYGIANYSVPTEVEESWAYDNKNNKVGIRHRQGVDRFTYVGSPETRQKMSKEFFELKDEVTARYLMMQIWGHHLTYSYALQKLAEGHYFGNTLSSEGLGKLFNLKSIEGASRKTVTNVELRSLGDKVETAMRLYYVAALSEKPARFKKELMESPGWKQFLFPDGTSPEFIKKWIGEPGQWETEVQSGGQRTKNTLRKEVEKGTRGLLTMKNIFASSDTYIENKHG